MECEFCKNIFSSKTNLNNHIKRATYCLKLRGIEKSDDEQKCEACNKIFSRKYELDRHSKICKKNNILQYHEKTIKLLRNSISNEMLKIIIICVEDIQLISIMYLEPLYFQHQVMFSKTLPVQHHLIMTTLYLVYLDLNMGTTTIKQPERLDYKHTFV